MLKRLQLVALVARHSKVALLTPLPLILFSKRHTCPLAHVISVLSCLLQCGLGKDSVFGILSYHETGSRVLLIDLTTQK